MHRSGTAVNKPLLWLSLLILSSGIVAFLLFRSQVGTLPRAREAASVSLGLAILLAGIFLIVATHRWWFTR
ncbi:MAG: hypothetical protein DRP22_03275 [Verrucomicrobia bacterium]|nr:MAG: hypothetical protein DRP22_03275 [Verrucomicrobiota bacterium]